MITHLALGSVAVLAYLAAAWLVRPDPDLSAALGSGGLDAQWHRLQLVLAVVLLPGYALARPIAARWSRPER